MDTYTPPVYTIWQTDDFKDWLRKLRDLKARTAIIRRLDRAAAGNLGDCAPVGGGVSEMRIHVGPGYRVYFVQRGDELIVVLAGGDKKSQHADIARAHALAHEV